MDANGTINARNIVIFVVTQRVLNIDYNFLDVATVTFCGGTEILTLRKLIIVRKSDLMQRRLSERPPERHTLYFAHGTLTAMVYNIKYRYSCG